MSHEKPFHVSNRPTRMSSRHEIEAMPEMLPVAVVEEVSLWSKENQPISHQARPGAASWVQEIWKTLEPIVVI